MCTLQRQVRAYAACAPETAAHQCHSGSDSHSPNQPFATTRQPHLQSQAPRVECGQIHALPRWTGQQQPRAQQRSEQASQAPLGVCRVRSNWPTGSGLRRGHLPWLSWPSWAALPASPRMSFDSREGRASPTGRLRVWGAASYKCKRRFVQAQERRPPGWQHGSAVVGPPSEGVSATRRAAHRLPRRSL